MDQRELQCFMIVSEEMHFARAAERLYLSPGRVSQLIKALETRVGAPLFERTSRRVALTPLGERFLADLRPAYQGMQDALSRARNAARSVDGVLRVGFLGTPTEVVTETVTRFEGRHPSCAVELIEIPLSDPFGKLRAGLVDISFTLLPVTEPDLAAGEPLNSVPLKVALSPAHPMAGRPSLDAEDLAEIPLIGLSGPAPRRWRRLTAPEHTPAGRPIPSAGTASTSQEGLTQVALNRGAMLFCTPTAAYHGRSDVKFVPVTGLPPSSLGLIWCKATTTAAIRAFHTVALTR
ncbi:LysR family transcriptional regulator [Actinocorallia longicatena]|uniref:LysR family transcriptional regulator n=1 Tax=Actinocorallia longicatena TaxID=111803 RepID=A0ABP6PY29_9ACTN